MKELLLSMKLLANTKILLIKNKRFLVLSLSLTFILFLYFILWHYSGLRIIGSNKVTDVSAEFITLAANYLILSVLLSSLIIAAMAFIKRPFAKKILMAIILFFFLLSEIIRIIDWGALYFGGSHVDGNFWSHAFYADGLVFLTTKTAFALYGATIFFFSVLFYILNYLAASSLPEEQQ